MIKNLLPKQTITWVGLALVVLANPLLYLGFAATIVDVRNLFGAGIDRTSISFSGNDPFFQAMLIVVTIGGILIGLGRFTRKGKKLSTHF